MLRKLAAPPTLSPHLGIDKWSIGERMICSLYHNTNGKYVVEWTERFMFYIDVVEGVKTKTVVPTPNHLDSIGPFRDLTRGIF